MLVYFAAHLVPDRAAKTTMLRGMNTLMWTTSQQELEFQIILSLLMKGPIDSVNVLQNAL